MRIKNIIRKATVAALTAVMILAPIVNVKAASSDVIDTSKTGSLTIHKYDMTAAKQAGVNLDQFTSTGNMPSKALSLVIFVSGMWSSKVKTEKSR